MKSELRMPTLVGILLLFFSLGVTVFLFKNIRSLLGRANPAAIPSEIKITNLTDNGFTVSWITSAEVNGSVNFGEDESLGNIALDDRDQVSSETTASSTHHVTLRYLKPQTDYYFKIISASDTFDNNGRPYVVTTAPVIEGSSQLLNPAHGTVQKSDQTPADGAIVYLSLPNSTLLSTIVRSSGNWLITLSTARTADLVNFITTQGNEKMEIFVQAGKEGTAQVLTTFLDSSPVPQITLGKTYNFASKADLTSSPTPTPFGLLTPTPTPAPTVSPTSTPASSPTATPSSTPLTQAAPSLEKPESDDAIPSDRPVFSGTGVPGQIIAIKIESTASITATTKVNANGNWSWTPPSGLSPGNHTVTITTVDSAGKTVKFVRDFLVLASGTSVVEAATPSATPRVSASPSPTPTPFLSPSPTPVATPPTSGNLTPTLVTFLLGLVFICLGVGKLILLDKP